MTRPIKLPKQWKHWCKMNRLKIIGDKKRRPCDLKGRGRYWRINIHGQFEVSCPIEYFDRWANSSAMDTDIPKTRAEFEEDIEFLLGFD